MTRSMENYRKCHREEMSLRYREICYCSNCHESSKFHESFRSHERLIVELLVSSQAVRCYFWQVDSEPCLRISGQSRGEIDPRTGLSSVEHVGRQQLLIAGTEERILLSGCIQELRVLARGSTWQLALSLDSALQYVSVCKICGPRGTWACFCFYSGHW